MPQPLDPKTFAVVVKSTPLVSIDLLVQDQQGRYLLGQRKNRPAQGFLFVPGGRVFKGETLDVAFLRLTQAELGRPLPRANATFSGLYEHLYDDNVFGEDFGTHYVVLAHALPPLDLGPSDLPREQHGDYRWMSPEQIRQDPRVHRYTKAYFD